MALACLTSQHRSTHAPSLSRLMDALVGLGVFARDPVGKLCLTPMLGLLQQDHPASLQSMVLYLCAPSMQTAWMELGHTVKAGEAAF